MSAKTITLILIVAGIVGGALAVVDAFAVAMPGAVVPIALPVAFWVAGTLAVRAQPQHLVSTLLLAVGSTHLLAFGMSTVVSAVPMASGTWVAWLMALGGNILFAAGFGCLALCLALFPNGSFLSWSQRALAWASVIVCIGVPVLAAVTSSEVELTLPLTSGSVAAPTPLPWGDQAINLFPVTFLLVVAGVLILVARGRHAVGDERRQLVWPTGAGALLVVMIISSAAGTAVLGQTVWDLLFVIVIGTIPFALLAGLVRFRLLDVDLLVARTVAQGIVLAIVICAFAIAAALASNAGVSSTWPAAIVAVLAALVGGPLRSRLERLADRWLSGGRARGQESIRQLTEELSDTEADSIAQRTAETIASGLDVSWVHVEAGAGPPGRAGTAPAGSEPEVSVALMADGQEIGDIACGPRHGGWGETDVDLVRTLARHASLALNSAALSATLAEQVQQLESSRARLVMAEEEGRRKVERDLHDGVQQQLIVLLARSELLRAQLPPGSAAAELATQTRDLARSTLVDLRSLVDGIHPPVLTDRGLIAAVEARVGQLPIDVALDVHAGLHGARFPAEVEGAAYFVACESLTNVMKHSGSRQARVTISGEPGGQLRVTVSDGGCGDARLGIGTGLAGLRDRVEALGGVLGVRSEVGAGTTVSACVPCAVTANA